MSLSKEAIEHIEQKAIAVSEKQTDQAADHPFRIVPTGMSIESIEQFMFTRNQFRAKMETESIDDFIKYFKDYEGDNCFINAENMAAKSIFDLGTTSEPEHCKHKASLSLKKTAAFKAVNRLSGNQFSQRELADWLEEWHDFVIPLEDNTEKKPMAMAMAIASIRKLTIESKQKSDHEERNFSTRKTAMSEIEAKSEDGLPGYFQFKCVPYDGLEERTFDIRIGIKTSHETPYFSLRVMREESIAEELAKEFKEILTKNLPEDTSTYIGSLAV